MVVALETGRGVGGVFLNKSLATPPVRPFGIKIYRVQGDSDRWR